MRQGFTQPLSAAQNEMIFENMSDGIVFLDRYGRVTYMNAAAGQMLLNQPDTASVLGLSFVEQFASNKKNRGFNRLFQNSIERKAAFEKTDTRYRGSNRQIYHMKVSLSLVYAEEKTISGMVVMLEDSSDHHTLRQREHDCACIFAGLILGITLYLTIWRYLCFTRHIYLSTATYTAMIEGITFALFLEIIFLTSFSLRDIGLVPKWKDLKKNMLETLIAGTVVCAVILLTKVILTLIGYHIKEYFIGGSVEGALHYCYTAFFQEFLARGVIQTSVKNLMRIKYQKAFGIVLTSLLFSLMHMPFGFYFMFGAFLLSLALGYVYERQKNIWGCVLLHWCCGYLAMCLFF